ncbi:DEAD H (Asp-Glu-Ala-Asp His) box helicase 11 [Lunasporangiospora selenospora]|uniref:ATP-dependent DNA helicase CHL1 n=1 Tax=Lunasporangiospora selenospora TaxID=979761 RepID=A0A9P6FWL1_9FUNG|nr:DEAD H (Asp-Glu-Ala-Asp His) box helicase 11 [Lunasporangiospora selenospora]
MEGHDSWEKFDNAHEQAQEEERLWTPDSFPAFPYPSPYGIQIQFMQQLFECIDQHKVGIFESPTGTGKSLSMICGAVGWLMEHEKAEQERVKKELEQKEEVPADRLAKTGLHDKQGSVVDDTPDWVLQHRTLSDATIEQQEREQRRQELDQRVQRIREKEKRLRENMARKLKRQATGRPSISSHPSRTGQKKQKGQDSDEEPDDSEFLLDEYDSDDNAKRRQGARSKDDSFGSVSKEMLIGQRSSLAFTALTLKKQHIDRGREDLVQMMKTLSLMYSRTHSQLTQFVEELRKTSYGEHLHVISLGSRKNLCINEKFRQKATISNKMTSDPVISVNKLNDACMEAQKSGTPSDQRCEFLHFPSSTALGPGKDTITRADRESSTASFGWSFSHSAVNSDEKLLEFRDHALARVRDIEELAELGTELETCPYYGSRQTVRHCQLVTLPYNLLLHASTRDSLKLAIKGNVLLLDEAHNLINSLLQMHSVSLSLSNVVLAQDQLQVYLDRYEKRLSSKNEGYIRVLIRLLKFLGGFLTKWSNSAQVSTPSGSLPNQQRGRPARPVDRVMKVNEFLHDAGMDHINLFKAHAYLETSGVARKLQGLHESIRKRAAKKLEKEQKESVSGRVVVHKAHNGGSEGNKPSVKSKLDTMSSTPVLLIVDAFLMSLLNADNDGRVIVTMETESEEHVDPLEDNDRGNLSAVDTIHGQKPVLKFMLLNPANVFRPLVEEARSVVLAGGTMEPVSDLITHLFPYLKEEPALSPNGASSAQKSDNLFPRIHRFSCGHVIPKENLLTLVMEKAPTGGSLELNFANRNQPQVMDGIGHSLVNLLNMIPDGVVVFFVSYSYMAQRIFIEPRETSEADKMLKAYQECIYERPEHEPPAAPASHTGGPTPKGAVLFSVVGGKMSEGINFSDRLGRGVVMIGMPFPNKGSIELQERMRYMDQIQQQEMDQGRQTLGSAVPLTRLTAGSEYYENLCMRAVNQSIGRAIRHQNDHAVIVLMDKRYGTPRIRKKLPGWIGSSLECCEQFGPIMGKLAGFFRTKRQQALQKQ